MSKDRHLRGALMRAMRDATELQEALLCGYVTDPAKSRRILEVLGRIVSAVDDALRVVDSGRP